MSFKFHKLNRSIFDPFLCSQSSPTRFHIFAHICVCVCVCYHAPKCKQLACFARKHVLQNLDLGKRPLKLLICDTSHTGHTATLCSRSLMLPMLAESGTRICTRELSDRKREKKRDRQRENTIYLMPKTNIKLLNLTAHECQKLPKIKSAANNQKQAQNPLEHLFILSFNVKIQK